MNRLLLLIFPLLLVLSCISKHHSDAPPVTINILGDTSTIIIADTVPINRLKSSINWTATEMRGLKKRAGKISFSKGYCLFSKQKIVGGSFIVDMKTIDVTDIPAHEKEARRNLIAHLKSKDFFYTKTYPVSNLKFTSVQKLSNDSLKIRGDLTIRNVTKNITFFAQQKGSRFIAKFTFNRLDWKVAYTGSWADKTLVDNDIELAIEVTF